MKTCDVLNSLEDLCQNDFAEIMMKVNAVVWAHVELTNVCYGDP